jgi:hypothetical protein
MPVIESQSVKIGIAASAGGEKSVLRLNYRSQTYDLVRVFATHHLEPTDVTIPKPIVDRLQRSFGVNSPDAVTKLLAEEYLLVREIGYYSLWQLDRSTSVMAKAADRSAAEKLALQQASIWLFQELWLQWDELLGDRQLHLLSEDLVDIAPQLRSGVEVDRLAQLDLATTQALISWSETDSIAFARQLYHLTQKKLGHQFGTKLISEICRSMPDELGQKLVRVLNIPQPLL